MGKSEAKLIEGMLYGDQKAFMKFYKKSYEKLKRYVSQKVVSKADAEELVQDIYLAFLDSLPLFRGEAKLETFLYSIARHEVGDYWRKKYAKKVIRTVPFVNQIYTEKLYSAVQLSKMVEQVYRQLNENEVKMLRMKYEMGLSLKEMAKVLGISLKAAESRLFRARKSFQLAYSDLNER